MNRIIACLIATMFTGATGLVFGQNYPIKTIRIVAPFAPGGGTDFIARVTAQKMTELMGQQVIVENRPGAGGVTGADFGAKAPPDGYTYTLVSGSYTVNPSLYKLSFDPVNDITAVIQMSQGPFLIAVHPSLPIKTTKELIALAKAKPDQLAYATSGAGSITHLATELFADMAGIKMIHVPYKGTAPALTDTIAGHVQMTFGSVAATLPQVKSGRLRGIAVSTAKRIPGAPEIPTVIESSSLKDYDVILWHGLIAPRGLPRQILERVNSDLNKVLQNKEMQDRLAGEGVAPAGGSPEQFQALIKKDIDVWRRIVQKTGVKAE